MPADIHPDLRRVARWAPRQMISRRTLPLVRIASFSTTRSWPIIPGAFHGFDQVVPGAGVSRAFFDSQCASLRKAFG